MIDKSLKKIYKSCTIQSPNGSIQISKHILEFIEDNTQFANNWEKNNIEKIIKV